MKHQRWWSLVLGLLLAGCIGTDLVDDPPSAEARIDITPATAAVLQGETVRFEAAYYDVFGMLLPETQFRWESTNPSVASIDAEGVVSTAQNGQAMIIAHAEAISSMPALLTVVADPNQVARVAVTPDTLSLSLGTTQSFTATALNLNDETLAGQTFTWSSSNPEVATIDAAGVATALEAGTTHITASTDGIASSPAYLLVPGRSIQGTFVGRPGTTYMLAGTATLQEQPSGGLVLSFSSNFVTSSGPGLQVFLSASSAVNSSSLSLGDLQQTTGEQTYFVPDSVILETYGYVIIHCVPFNVTFGFARLQ